MQHLFLRTCHRGNDASVGCLTPSCPSCAAPRSMRLFPSLWHRSRLPHVPHDAIAYNKYRKSDLISDDQKFHQLRRVGLSGPTTAVLYGLLAGHLPDCVLNQPQASKVRRRAVRTQAGGQARSETLVERPLASREVGDLVLSLRVEPATRPIARGWVSGGPATELPSSSSMFCRVKAPFPFTHSPFTWSPFAAFPFYDT